METVVEAAWGSGDAHFPSIAMSSKPQEVRACGAPHLPLGFAWKPSSSAPWDWGLLSAFWERGSPDLPACGLRRGSKGGPSMAHLYQHRPKTLARGQASRGGRHGASSGTASSGWLARRRRDQGGVPHEVPVTQAMTTKGASRAPARAVSSFPLWCKGGKRSRGVPRHQAKVAISVQRDQDQEDYETEVTVEPKTASSPELCAGEDYFCQDS